MTGPSTDTLVRTGAPAGAPPTIGGASPVIAPEPAAVQPEEVREPEVTQPADRAGAPVRGARLIRFRMATDHHGLQLRAGEAVLCVPYEPAELGMVVLVRCESDGHAPGALVSVRGLVYVEEAGRYSARDDWDVPGTRTGPDGHGPRR